MNHAELKLEKQKRYDSLMKVCGLFWAFSNQQFEENKTPLEDGDKYVSLGAGGYMPKSNVKLWIAETAAIEKWYKAAIKKGKLDEQEILYSLRNHECFYTHDIEDAMEGELKHNYTHAQVWEVFHKYVGEEIQA